MDYRITVHFESHVVVNYAHSYNWKDAKQIVNEFYYSQFISGKAQYLPVKMVVDNC